MASGRLSDRFRGLLGILLGASRGHIWASPGLPGALRMSQEVPREAPLTPLGGPEAARGRLLFSGDVFWGVPKLLKKQLVLLSFLFGAV